MAQPSVEPTLSEIADSIETGSIREPEYRALVDWIVETIAISRQLAAA